MISKKHSDSLLVIAIVLVGLLAMASIGVAGASNPNFHQDDAASTEAGEALSAAAGWLISAHQNEDRGFSSFSIGADSAPSDVAGTVDALLALASANADYEPLISYLRDNNEQASAYAGFDGSTAGKLILSLVSAGGNPRDFGGHNFVITLTEHLSPTGQFGVNTAFNQSLAILGLIATGEFIPETAIEWLITQQSTEGDFAGSWDDGYGTLGNPDSTAMALMALTGSNQQGAEEAIANGIAFLQEAQLDTGGWEYGQDFGENANSTAIVVQALANLDEDISSPESPWANQGVSPLAALLSWQGETGAFQADFGEGRFDDFFSTVQSMPALSAVQGSVEQAVEPTVAAESGSDPEPAAQPEVSASVEEESKATVVEQEQDDFDQSEDSGGGLPICSAAFALPLFLGFAFVISSRRRR
jgi:hypothetical protein